MKLRLFALAVAVLALAGCGAVSEAVSQKMHDKFDRTPAKSRDFDGEFRSVYYAAQLAMKRIGYTLERSSIGEGIVVGQSAIQPGDPTRSARQLRLTVTLQDLGPQAVGVGLLMTEQFEGGMMGAAGEAPLREHGLYDSYFVALQAVMEEQARSLEPLKK